MVPTLIFYRRRCGSTGRLKGGNDPGIAVAGVLPEWDT
jgi:hypothetical protein